MTTPAKLMVSRKRGMNVVFCNPYSVGEERRTDTPQK